MFDNMTDDSDGNGIKVEPIDLPLAVTVQNQQEYKLYRKRWFILVAFFGINFMQCVSTICISALLSETAIAFHLPTLEVSLCNSSSALFFFPAFIAATQLFNRISSRKVLVICALLFLFGGWIRMVTMFNDQFWWVIIGQTIIGISSPFTTGAISIIANLWFGDLERGRATSLMTASNPLGIFVSFGI